MYFRGDYDATNDYFTINWDLLFAGYDIGFNLNIFKDKQKVKSTISHLVKQDGTMIENNEDITTALGQFSKQHLVTRL